MANISHLEVTIGHKTEKCSTDVSRGKSNNLLFIAVSFKVLPFIQSDYQTINYFMAIAYDHKPLH